MIGVRIDDWKESSDVYVEHWLTGQSPFFCVIRFCPCDDVQISRVPTSTRDQNSTDRIARGRDEESAKGQ